MNDIVIRKPNIDLTNKPHEAERVINISNNQPQINPPMTKQSKVIMKTTRSDFYHDYLEQKVVITDSSQISNSQTNLSFHQSNAEKVSPYVSEVQVIASGHVLSAKS